MKECSKSIARRLSDSDFINKYFSGHGLDIGGRPDPLGLYCELFCQMHSVQTWDLEDGDAQFLENVENDSFDFVHSSHCLEHLNDAQEGLANWLRVVKPGGHLIVTVPDEDLYEQGVFPSTFNADHKATFTIWKARSWSEKSLNVLDMVRELGAEAELLKLQLLASTYRFDLPRYDQTLSPVGECGIELVIRKRTAAELEAGGRILRPENVQSRETRIHLNQYRDDVDTLKRSNTSRAPFGDDKPI